MRTQILSFALIATLLILPSCGKDDAKPANSNPGPNTTAPANTNQPNGSNNCYCDECGCFILYNDGSYVDVDSCGAQPQQQYPQQQAPQQNYYPQNYGNNRPGVFPWLRNLFNSPQQGYGNPQQGYGYPQQNYGAPQQGYGYPQQNYGYPQQGYGYPQQNYGYPQQNYYPR